MNYTIPTKEKRAAWKKVQDAFAKSNMTPEQLAEALDMANSDDVYKWLSFQRFPSLRSRILLAHTFGVSLLSFVTPFEQETYKESIDELTTDWFIKLSARAEQRKHLAKQFPIFSQLR